MKKIMFLSILTMLSACNSNPTNTPKPSTSFSEVRVVVTGTMFASIGGNIDYVAMQDGAKLECQNEQICKIIIFPEGTVLPTAFPMTDREVSLSIGNYTLNRNSGTDELLARCPIVAKTPTDKCFSAD